MDVRVCLLLFSMAFMLIKQNDCVEVHADVMSVLRATAGFSKFQSLMTSTNLDTMYESQITVTLFAFTDDAYNSMPFDQRRSFDAMTTNEIADYIKSCSVFGETLMTSKFVDSTSKQSMAANSNRLYLNRRQRVDSTASGNFGVTTFYVNGVAISQELKDLSSQRGVVQGMTKIMTKSSLLTAFGYSQTPDGSRFRTSQFVRLLNELAKTKFQAIAALKSTTTFLTMFIPDDNAMQKIPPQKINEIMANDELLDGIIRAHFIPNKVIFTSYVNHNEGFISSDGKQISLLKNNDQAYVNSAKVNAKIVEGNITVANGVVHIVDQLLGYVFQSVREQVTVYAKRFDSLIKSGSQDFTNKLVQPSGVNLFVPLDYAFTKIANLPWINLNSDLALIQKILKLHTLESGQSIAISNIIGGYESRQFKRSMYNDSRLAIFNFRNQSWVNGGNVMAKIIQPDIGATNGNLHTIDTILGIPYLDLAMLICHDIWLLRTYDYMRSCGMKKYFTDRRFTSEKCQFEVQGYPPNYGINNNYPGTSGSCPTYCSDPSYQTTYPCNTAQCLNTQQIQCPSQCTNPAYQNTYPCNTPQCSGGASQTNNCPDYCSLPAYQNENTCLQCSQQGVITPSPLGASQYDMDYCGTVQVPCQNTIFVPNSTAIDAFLRTNDGRKISQEPRRLQYLFRRLLFNQLIYIDKLSIGNSNFKAQNGETIRVTKSNYRDVRIYFGSSSANLLMMDQGATNGVMHIIDNFLFVQADLTRDISGVDQVTSHVTFTLLMLAVIYIFRSLKIIP